MLEKLLLILIIVNIVIFVMIVRLFSPRSAVNKQQNRALPPIPYDPSDFGAFCSYMTLREMEKNGARFLFDCDVPGMDSPAEMIMLNKSGIYVFEHSTANGWIIGMENNDLWTQKVQRGYGRMPQEEKFPNPVYITEKKVRVLRKHLRAENIPIRSIVVFSDYCLLYNIKVRNPNVRVVVAGQLMPALVNLSGRSGVHMTQRQVDDIYDNLSQYEILPQETEQTEES